MTLLATHELKVHFGGVRALDGVSLAVGQAGVHAIIGPNGAGKTSFVNAVTGVYRALSGTVCLDDSDVGALSSYQLARRGVTRTFQNLQVFWTMTALENVECGFYLASDHGFWRGVVRPPRTVRRSQTIAREALAILDSVGLAERAYDMASNLSYGELKRLEIARAIAGKPRLLFLDEPVAGCTASEKKSLGDLIRRMADVMNIAIVVIEHDMRLVMSISDRVTVLVRGKVLADDAPEVVRNHAGVIEAYLGVGSAARERSHASVC